MKFSHLATAALLGFTAALAMMLITGLNEILASAIFLAGVVLGLAAGIIDNIGNRLFREF